MTLAERLQLFVRILDEEDYIFVRSSNPGAEAAFRRRRLKIFRGELRSLASGSMQLYRSRAANVAAAGRWSSYPSLVADTVSGFFSIGKLAAAGVLFSWRMPSLIDAAANADRVLRFMTSAPGVALHD